MYEELLDQLRLVAFDPQLATDEGHDIVDEHGKSIIYSANPVAEGKDISVAEARLGFALPPLLKEMYIHIGNGGFGPGYGLWGVKSVAQGEKVTVETEYGDRIRLNPEFPDWRWPAGLLPICDWGCGIVSCIDCLSEDGQVLRYDPDWDLPNHVGIHRENRTFEHWIQAWLDDEDLFTNRQVDR